MDKHTPEQRRRNMQAVKNKDSQIELLLRQELWSRGLRYRKNVNRIYGKPDIVFIGKKIAVFCDSEFWHGYNWEERKKDFKSHQEFWIPKIERNMERDAEVTAKLEAEGWTVLRFWGNEIKKNVSACADLIQNVWEGSQWADMHPTSTRKVRSGYPRRSRRVLTGNLLNIFA
jgi:DNA mismatch endonuclease Vsr